MSCVRMTRGSASWEIGTPADVSWIKDGTATGMTITSAIPPVFAAYATATDPETHDSNNAPTARYTEAVLQHLKAEALDQPWWLGYLDKPADVVFSEARRVDLYATWKYVLVKAGPDQAAAWRSTYWGDPLLPDLMFPHDRSWLLSTLWDDSWTCVGGSARLVQALLDDPRLDARRVRPGEDATPPGHTAH
jgi:hypothetical protein